MNWALSGGGTSGSGGAVHDNSFNNEWIRVNPKLADLFDGDETIDVASATVASDLDLIERHYWGSFLWGFLRKPTAEIQRLRRKVAENPDRMKLHVRDLLFLATHALGRWKKDGRRVIYFSGQSLVYSECPLLEAYRALSDLDEAYRNGDARFKDGFVVGKASCRKPTEFLGLKFQCA